MRKLLITIIFALPLLSFSQDAVTFLRSETKTNKLVIVPPVTLISVINKGSKQQIDSALTQETYRQTSKQLERSFPDSIDKVFFSADSSAKSRICRFIIKINEELKNERRVRKYKVPDSILVLFDSLNADYIFCTFNTGFKRTRNNLVNTALTLEVADVLIGLGMRPLESAALINCFIIDVKQKNILYFERKVWENSDPTDINVMKLMLTGTIAHYFI